MTDAARDQETSQEESTSPSPPTLAATQSKPRKPGSTCSQVPLDKVIEIDTKLTTFYSFCKFYSIPMSPISICFV